jgi:hypothetical protein
MAEIANDQDPSAPQGNFEGWTEKKSKNGKTFYYRAVDSEGATKKPEGGQAHQVDARGPSFSGAQCHWTSGTSGNTSTDFANETAITWYKLANTVGWTYELTINCTDTYDYTFHTPNDSYHLDVWQTSTTHEVTYTTEDPTVTSVDGS